MSERSPVAFGQYIITRRIARGGMAEIYRARTRGPEAPRWVALKMMRSSLGHEELRTRLFEREARIASRLNHKNVVPIYEYGEELSRPYLAMEYVRGRDVSHLLKNEKKGIPIPPYLLALYLGQEAARGLGHAHRQIDEETSQPLGIVHRDMSPGNVMVGYDGSVKVLDFGVARMNEAHGLNTQTGTLRGKFAYMSPEQTLGEDLDARSDVFSLGTVLYELLTGENCFRAPNPITSLERVQNLRPVPPSKANKAIPKDVDRILACCLAKDKKRRFKDGHALYSALAEFLQSRNFSGREELTNYLSDRFAWEKHEEERELQREEEEVRLFAVVTFDSLTDAKKLDAAHVVEVREEEASESEVRSMVRPKFEVGDEVFEPSGDSTSAPAPLPPRAHFEDEDETLAHPALFEDQPDKPGQVRLLSSLLAPEPIAEPTAKATQVLPKPDLGLPENTSSSHYALPAPPLKAPRPWYAKPGLWVVTFLIAVGGLSIVIAKQSGLQKALPKKAAAPATKKLAPVTISLEGAAKTKAKAKAEPRPEEDNYPLPQGDAAYQDSQRQAQPRRRRSLLGRNARRQRKRTVRARRGQQRNQKKGFLNVGARPWAQILIDGKRWPYNTPQAGIELSAGRHTVTLVNPETKVTKTKVVVIKPGTYRTLMLNMTKD